MLLLLLLDLVLIPEVVGGGGRGRGQHGGPRAVGGPDWGVPYAGGCFGTWVARVGDELPGVSWDRLARHWLELPDDCAAADSLTLT